MWSEDEFEDFGGPSLAKDKDASPRRSGRAEQGRLDVRNGADRYRNRREDAGRDEGRRNGSPQDQRGRHSRGDMDAARRGGRAEPARDWIPDRFNRNDDGGRQRGGALAQEERGGRGGGYRGHERRDTSGTDELPPLYSIHHAAVQSVRPFGMFVKMDGFRKQGLVHVTQVSEHEVTKRDDPEDAKVEALRGVASEGDKVWVKVISLKEGEGGGPPKVGCSLKLVSQADGRDLDPNNLILDRHERKPTREEPKKFELGAVLDVTCTRCGGRGHLKTDCYAALDTQYELLPDEDEAAAVPGGHVAVRGQGSGSNNIPLGRGRGMTQPAWMTQANAAENKQIGKSKGSEGNALPAHIGSVEEALAVIAKLNEDKRERKARRKERREKKRKKRRKKESDEDGSSSDTSESEDERRQERKRRKERKERKHRKRAKSTSASSSDSEGSSRGHRRKKESSRNETRR